MAKITIDQVEKKLMDIRLKTSPALDDRVRKMARGSGAESQPQQEQAERIRPSAPGAVDRRTATLRVVKMGAAIAASLVLALVSWWLLANGHRIVPSAYADLAKAVHNTKAAQWVHIRMDVEGQPAEVWISFKPNRAFKKQGQEVELADYQARRRWKYDPAARTIAILEMVNEEDPLGGAENLLDLMLAGFERAKEENGVSLVRGEEVIDGKKYVTFTMRVEAQGVPAHGRVLVDPELKRIVRMERLVGSEGMTEPQVIEFEYPKTGPADIYDLGVPKDAKIANLAPGWNVPKIKNAIASAEKQFAKSYYAIIANAVRRSDGTLRLGQPSVTVVHKGSGNFRVDRYSIQLDDVPEDFAAFEVWTKRQPIESAYFYPPNRRQNATRVQMGNAGKLERKKIGNVGLPHEAVERQMWHVVILGLGEDIENTILPETKGEFGQLVGVEKKRQGKVHRRSGFVQKPLHATVYFNPSRDWIIERAEIVWDADARWQKDKDWLKRQEIDPLRRWSRSSYEVVKYAQTEDGHWYPAEIQNESQSRRRLASGEIRDYKSQSVILIYLDTSRNIPDSMFDPESINSPERFNSNTAKWRIAFEKAIAEIDRRDDYPETPEEVAKAYWEARNAKNFEEMAVLWPGSARWNESLKDEKPIQYVFGKARKLDGRNIVVPYATSKELIEQNKCLHMRLRNERSAKGRYYITSGN